VSQAVSTRVPGRATFGLVILNWNNAADTIECLENLVECDPRPERIAIVDNGSADSSLAEIQSWWESTALHKSLDPDWIDVIAAGANLGFAGGSNVGLRRLIQDSSLSHIILLNNDTIIPPDFFRQLRDALSEAGNPGILGPTIREYPDTEKVWYAGAREYFFRGLVQHRLDVPADPAPHATDFVTGCAMVVSRRVLEEVGDLSEAYFPAYFEDSDLCHRARRAGFSIVYAPRPLIYHKVGSTVRSAAASLELAYIKNRLRVIYVRRNYRGMRKIIALSYLAFTKPARTAVEIMKGQPGHAWQVLRGTAAGFLARDIT
jgi:GT2 family glycosyltransferase